LAVLGVVFQYQITGKFMLLAILISNGAYIISIAPLAWLIMSEIFPNRVRGKAMGICGLVLWVSAFGTTYAFPIMRDFFENHYGTAAGAFWVFAGVCVVAWLFSYKLVPETKGRTLEEIGA